VALALLAGHALAPRAGAQGTAKGTPGVDKAPAGGEKTVTPKAEEKRITFSMGKKPWGGRDGVIQWLADQLGKPFVGKYVPLGTFTFIPPVIDGKPQTYTLPEVVDIINRGLQDEKFTLLRFQDSFKVVPADELFKPTTERPRITLPELASRGNTEVVELVYPLKAVNAEDIAAEVKSVMSPTFSRIIVLQNSNQLLLQDTAGSLKRVDEILKQIENYVTKEGTATLEHECIYITALKAAELLKSLLGEEKQEVKFVTKEGGTSRTKVRVHKVAVNEATNTVLVTGPADKIGKAKEILKRIDVGTIKVARGEPFLRMHQVPGGNAEKIAKFLSEVPEFKGSGTLRIEGVSPNTIAVWAGPEYQIKIAKMIGGEDAKGSGNKTAFIPLTVTESEKAATFLQKAFGDTKAGAPFIEADVGRNGVFVRGTASQVEEVRNAVSDMEGVGADALAKGGMRVFNLDQGSAAALAEALKTLIEKQRPDAKVKILLPGRDLGRDLEEKTPEKKPAPKSGKKLDTSAYHETAFVGDEKEPGKGVLVDPIKGKEKKKGGTLSITAFGPKLIVTSDDPELLKLVQELVTLITRTPAGAGDFEVIRLKKASAIDAARVLD